VVCGCRPGPTGEDPAGGGSYQEEELLVARCNTGWCCHHVWHSTPSLGRSTQDPPAPSRATVHPVGVEHDVLTGRCMPLSSALLVAGRRREREVKMTKLRMGRGIGHHKAAPLMPPRWLRVFPSVRRAHGGATGFPARYGLTGSVADDPEPRGSGKAHSDRSWWWRRPWGASVAPQPVFPPVEPTPAASATSRELSHPSAPTTRTRVVLLPHVPSQPTISRIRNRRTPQ
jgi:hypothetical protein